LGGTTNRRSRRSFPSRSKYRSNSRYASASALENLAISSAVRPGSSHSVSEEPSGYGTQ
jgi:hypothetical protein